VGCIAPTVGTGGLGLRCLPLASSAVNKLEAVGEGSQSSPSPTEHKLHVLWPLPPAAIEAIQSITTACAKGRTILKRPGVEPFSNPGIESKSIGSPSKYSSNGNANARYSCFCQTSKPSALRALSGRLPICGCCLNPVKKTFSVDLAKGPFAHTCWKSEGSALVSVPLKTTVASNDKFSGQST